MSLPKKVKLLINIIIHIALWSLLIYVTIIFDHYEELNIGWLFTGPALPLFASFILFYINLFIVIKKFLLQKRYLIFILINILLMILFLWLMHYIRNLGCDCPKDMHFDHGPGPGGQGEFGSPPPPPHEKPLFGFVDRFIWMDAVTLFVALIISIAVKATKQWIVIESEKKEIEKQNIESNMELLRYQLHPHFFFNSLNNIYSLIDSEPEKAKDSVYNLGKMMRYLLHENNLIDLSQEIDFLKKYFSLMKLRLRPDIIAELNIKNDMKGYRVVPFLFIPLMENAFKHGVSSTEKSEIIIDMYFEKDKIHFITKNTNFPKKETDKSGSGIGLNNLKKRLDILYPDNYVLDFKIINGYYHAILIIPV